MFMDIELVTIITNEKDSSSRVDVTKLIYYQKRLDSFYDFVKVVDKM